MGTFETVNDNSGEKSAEGTGQDGSGDVDSKSLGLFGTLVPGREHEEDTGSKAGFDATDQGSEDNEMFEVLNHAHDDGEGSPDDHNGREEIRRAAPAENKTVHDVVSGLSRTWRKRRPTC